MNARRLYIVDDNAEFLESTRFWLSGAGFDVQTWGDPMLAIDALLKRDRRHHACLMLDVRMPRMSGLDLHDALRERDADLPVIYMSGHADVPLTVRAMRKGAVTLLEKPFDETMLEAALAQAFEREPDCNGASAQRSSSAPSGGRPVRTDASQASAGAELSDAQTRFAARHGKLSPRERQVLDFVIQGTYNKVIADRVGLSIKTVELYRARGMTKMQARSVAELTRMMVTREID